MKKLACLSALLLLLALSGCAGQGTNPQPTPSGNFNWGADAACSPGCPAGMSGSW